LRFIAFVALAPAPGSMLPASKRNKRNQRATQSTHYSIVEAKPQLNRNLPIVDLIVLDVTASFDDLKPMNVVKRLTRFGNGVLHGVFDTCFR
jgi:hypothetical protein